MKKQQHHRFEILDHLATSGVLRALEIPVEDRASEVIRLADYVEKGDPLRAEEFELQGEDPDALDVSKYRVQTVDVPEPAREGGIRGLLQDLLSRTPGPPPGVELKDGEYWCESHQEVHNEADKPSVGSTLADLLGGGKGPGAAQERQDARRAFLQGNRQSPPPPPGLTPEEFTAQVASFVDSIGGESASPADVDLNPSGPPAPPEVAHHDPRPWVSKTSSARISGDDIAFHAIRDGWKFSPRPDKELRAAGETSLLPNGAGPDPRPWKSNQDQERISRDKYRSLPALAKAYYHWRPRTPEELESAGDTGNLPGAASAAEPFADPYPFRSITDGSRISTDSFDTFGTRGKILYAYDPRTQEEFEKDPEAGRTAEQPKPLGRPIKDQPQA